MTQAYDDLELDALLAGLRQSGPQPSAALQARVIADAISAQPRQAPVIAHRPARRSAFRALADLFGGEGALAGMGLAAAAGVFIGISQPAPVAALTQALAGGGPLDSLELLPTSDEFWTED